MTDWTAVGNASWWGVAWVADMGAYSGPDVYDIASPIPAGAGKVEFWVGVMGGDIQTASLTGSFTFARRTSSSGFPGNLSGNDVDPATAHLFAVWYDPASPADPADLVAPSLTPDALVAGYLIAFVEPPPPPPPVDRPTVALFDTDGTFIQDLPLAAGIQFQEEVSAPGALSFRLPLSDAATSLVTALRVVKVSWRGGPKLAARIGASSTDVAVDGTVWRQWSNLPGLLSLLGGVLVYPEYGVNRAGNSSRTLGYMAKTGHGEWLGSGNWTPADGGVSWAAMTGARAGMPPGLEDITPSPQWIAKNGPNADYPPLSYQYMRRRWTSTTACDVQILTTADNYLDLWLDGEQIVDSRGQGQFTWREAFVITARLPAGLHVLAARIRNHRDTIYATNRMGFLFTMQQTGEDGKPIAGPPLINSDDEWLISDVTPGFRRADMLDRVWGEAVDYGYAATNLLTLGFTRTTDSDGNDFDDPPGEYTVDVGQSLLDVVSMLTEKNLDVGIDAAALQVQAWNRRGADLTDTVVLALGHSGGSLIGHGVERTEPGANTILMQLADGRWVQRQDLAGVAARGREGSGLSMGSTSDTATANQTADAQLTEMSEGTAVFTTQVSSLIGSQVYVDFGLGDTITVPDEDGISSYAVRLMAITVDASGDGPVQVTLELMLDRSATPLVLGSGGAGSDDPGDLGASDGGTGGSTGLPTETGGTDVAYDWTANPYGSAYDAAGGTGGYVPDDTHSGVPSGASLTTLTATGGFLTINTAARLVGTGSASASTNKITLTAHGLANGAPVYFSALSGDGAGLSTGVAGWCVVSAVTANTFSLKRLNEDTGTFSTVNITADYFSVTVQAGVWYDLIDFACHLTIASSATGLLLLTRCRHRGPASALSPTGATPAQGLIFNLSSAYVLAADVDLMPDAPVAKLDALYGKNFRTWRRKHKHVIDGVGSHGNNIGYGTYGTGAAWFYPDPEHTDGSHCDLGMQVFGGAKHREVGAHIEGLVDASVSSTSDPTGHPIPTWTNTVLQVNHAGGLVAPTDVTWPHVLLGGGGYTINVDGKEDRPNLGSVTGRFKRNARYGAIAAPSPGAKAGGATIQYGIAGTVYDDDNSTIAAGNGLYVSPGSHLVP